MNEEQFDDLKQFIVTTVSQTEASIKDKMDNIQIEMLEGFAGVGEAIDALGADIDERGHKQSKRLDNHELRCSTNFG